ncbi:MAG TPA: calcium/sodium antiporter [Kofleriaceae bacterium]|nr:calcium/sodium antiporter [Kofleriaceae bacterium]
MFTVLDVGQLILGIAILYWGAEWLIRGSAALARAWGVKPLVVGLTVVAYGTSAPELAVATKTALAHSQPIALGTVIGSCAANISLILGLTALISPPTIDGRIIRREVPVLVGSAIAVPILFRNGVLSQLEGALLILCAIIFTIVTLTVSARMDLDVEAEPEPSASGSLPDATSGARAKARATTAAESGSSIGGRGRPRVAKSTAALMSLVGLVLLVTGSHLFVRGGRGLAAELGMSERMLGLTVISIGCALPELIGSLIAAARGHAALAVGSVIGSNLLNVFLVLGVTAYLGPIRLGERMHLVDLAGLVAITLLGVVTLRGSRKISRLEGAVLVLAYVAFIVCAAIL